jgi:hypothetical protein
VHAMESQSKDRNAHYGDAQRSVVGDQTDEGSINGTRVPLGLGGRAFLPLFCLRTAD